MGVWVIAHRGASSEAPENTMAAFRRAVEADAEFIETDLQLSRDARLVALHDDMLDRTTNAHGPVSARTLEELRQLDAGSWFSDQGFSGEGSSGEGSRGAPHESFAGQRIPTLDEILAFGRERDIGLYLEMKTPAVSGAEHTLAGALRDSGEIVRTVILSFDLGLLAKVRRFEPLMVTGHLCDRPAPDAVRNAVEMGARQLLPRADGVTAELVREAHASDLKVVTWTVNAPEQAAALVAAGVDGIITDYPREMIALFACA
jgi:glycerophosphoryl diester phosphodiesterase